jgi:hypothetical protein
MIRSVLVFDFDGCISKCSWRESLLPANGLVNGYDLFHELLILDPPNMEIITMMKLSKMEGYKVIILTGRKEENRHDSVRWLNRYSVCYDAMYMRPNNDHRPSQIYKSEVLSTFDKNDIKMIFDDMEKNINHFKELGYPTCLVKC